MAGLQYNDIVTAQAGMNREQIAQQAQNLAPVIQPGQSSQAITVGQLAPAQPMVVPQAPPTPNNLEPAVASATQTSKSLADYIKELTPPETDTSKQYNSLLGDLNNLLPGLTGRGEAQLSAEQSAGIPELKKQLSELNAQILSKTAEANLINTKYDTLSTSLEGQAIPLGLITGQQSQVRKMQLAESNNKASEIGLLQARALGLQGNVQAAQETVNRAIDLRYQDREATVDLKMKQLQLLEGKLNKEESIQKAALERKYQVEQQQIADEKAKAKENITLALENKVPTRFANKRGEIFDTNSGVAYATPEQFFKAANVKSFEEAYAKGLITDISQVSSIDLKRYPASYQEYLLAKQDGFTGNYNEYQNMDANRKAVRSTTINNITDATKTQALFQAQAPATVAQLKKDGYTWQQIVDEFTQKGIDVGDKAVEDALQRNFRTAAEYNVWKSLNK